jgi:hypothetical protein
MKPDELISIICPRCEGYIPSNDAPGAYPGALSRTDNETEICSQCGVEEALIVRTPKSEWPVTQSEWPVTLGDGIRYLDAHDRRLVRIMIESEVIG